MDSIKNIFLIIVLVGLIGVAMTAFFRGLSSDMSASKNNLEEVPDYRYRLPLKTPDGEEFSEIRIHGEITPKPRDGFFFKDVENNVIFDVRSDGSVKYYQGK